MLALTKKTGYALGAMTYLARQESQGISSAREIANVLGAPPSLMMNVLKQLAAKGYVESIRGAKGGYRLARDINTMTLADLVETMEGPVRLSQCVADPANHEECTLAMMASCPVHDPVHRIQRRLNDFLKKVTLAELTT